MAPVGDVSENKSEQENQRGYAEEQDGSHCLGRMFFDQVIHEGK